MKFAHLLIRVRYISYFLISHFIIIKDNTISAIGLHSFRLRIADGRRINGGLQICECKLLYWLVCVI